MKEKTFIGKRIASFFLALAMIITLAPPLHAHAKEVTVLDGKVSINDTAGSISESGGTVTITAKGSLLSSTKNNITIKNISSGTATLSFSFELTGKNSEYTLPNSATSGTFSVLLAPEATYTMMIKGKGGLGGGNATLKLSNFGWSVAAASSDVTINYDSTLGSVTAGGNAVTSGTTQEVSLSDGVALVATPKSGVTFLGWVDEATGAIIDKNASFTYKPASDVIVRAAFATNNGSGTPWFGVGTASTKTFSSGFLGLTSNTYYQVGTSYLFDNLTAAANKAGNDSSNKVIVLMNTGTLPSGTYTIPAGVTLLIPFDDEKTMYTTAAQSISGKKADNSSTLDAYEVPKEYRKMTMASGANLVINGAVSLSAKHIYAQGGFMGGVPTGNCSFIDMQSNSSITVNNGGKLYAYGYITGSGSVTANSGATVYEMFQFMDFRGGSQSTDSGMQEHGVFPLSQYYVQNIEVPLTLYAGAKEYACTSIYMSSTNFFSAVEFIGSSGSMFALTSGSVTKRYDGTTDRLMVTSSGDITVSSININMGAGGININSKNYELPINSNISLTALSGKLTINQDIALFPGAEITVNSGASCTLGSGYNVYIYDADQWGTFAFGMKPNALSGNANYKFIPVYYAPGRTYTRTEADLVDAKIVVNGTMDASKGNVYTTAGGANIISEGGGVVITKPGTQTVTHQLVQGTEYTKIPITPAKLKNGDGKYAETGKAASGSKLTMEYQNGKWVCTEYIADDQTHVHVDGAEEPITAAGCTTDGLKEVTCAVCSEVYEKVIPANGHTEVTDAAVAPTCTETGLTVGKHCSVCGTVTVAQTEVPALGHTPGAAADCENPQTCTVCGEELAPALGHKWTDADCDTPKTCSVCGETEGEPNGHSWKDATCTDPKTCSVCGETEGEANGHSWKDATCTDPKTCSVCGETEGEANGHKWIIKEYVWAEDHTTCTAYGVCGNSCGSTTTAVATNIKVDKLKDPTCTEYGENTYTATFDVTWAKETKDSGVKDIPPLGHTWTLDKYEWSVDGKTCTAHGKCACGATTSANGVISSAEKTPATCTEKGWTTYTADFEAEWAVDGQTKDVQDIPATGHSFQDIAANPATCLAAGNEAHKQCTVCKLYFAADAATDSTTGAETNAAFVISRKDHSYTGEIRSDGNGKDATHSFQCVNGCNEYGAAVQHTWNEGKETIAPGCESEGEKTFTCTAEGCGATYTEAIPAIGHDWKISGYTNDGETHTVIYVCENDETHTKSESGVGHDFNDKHECVCGATNHAHDHYDITETTHQSICSCGEKLTEAETHNGGTASCTEKAKCTVCGGSYGELKEHSFTEKQSETKATCMAEGLIVWKCANCDATKDEILPIDKDAHTGNNRTENAQKPTCTEEGYTGDTVCECGTTIEYGITIDEKGHSWNVTVQWTQNDGTWSCTASGICANDQAHTESETVTAVDSVKTEPDCENMGWTLYTATFTGEWIENKTQIQEQKDIPALDHEDQNGDHLCDREDCDEVCGTCNADSLTFHGEVKATCQNEGNTAYYSCTCGKFFSDDQAETEIEQNAWITEKDMSNHGSDEVTYINNGDTHTKKHACCGVGIETVAHSYTDGKCICGDIEQVTVTWKDSQGNVIATETVDYGQDASTDKTPPEVFGYTSTLDTTVENVTKDEEIKVVLTPKTFGINWFVDGELLESTTITYNTTVATVTAPKKTGYNFLGWYDADGKLVTNETTYLLNNLQINVPMSEDDTAAIAGSTDLYAKYEIKTYTITWNVDGTETTETYEHFQTPKFPGTTDKVHDENYHYDFAGWDSDSDGVVDGISEVSCPVTYTAVYTEKAHADSATDDNHICDYGCGKVLEDCDDVTWNYTDNDDGTHDANCSVCNALMRDDEKHQYDENGKCVCGAVEETTVYVAEVNGTEYETLAEAVNAAEDGDTVTLLGDASDAGVVIDKDITIDFGGHTYTFTEGVGSTGTESNGFQILQGNTVTLKNGTLNVATESADKFYMLIQNYANLTVEDMTLDGTNLDKWSLTDGDSYTLSNNSGTVNITGNTSIIANNDGDKAFAFDVCKYQSYAEPVVTVAETVSINGNVEAAARVGNVYYATLTKAVASAKDNETVYLLMDKTGAGVVIDKDITIDFGGYTYTINSAVGSAGTETLGLQLLAGNNVTLRNGALTANNDINAQGKVTKVLVMNYANLTMEGMTLTGNENVLYCLSINSGSVSIEDSSIIAAAGKVAFDACKYASYDAPAVMVSNTKVTGKVEITGGSVDITSGEYNADFDVQSGSLNVTGGTFSENVTEYCADGFHTADGDGDGIFTYGEHEFGTEWIADNENHWHACDCGAVSNKGAHGYDNDFDAVCDTCGYERTAKTAVAVIGEQKFASLEAAVAAAETGDTVTLLGNASGVGVVIDKDITIDFGTFTYTFTEGVGSTGTESNGFQILQGNTVTLKNGTLNVATESADKFYMLIQNYANLTVEDMTLDGTNLDKWSLTDGDSYTLSNNSGTVNIIGETNIIANNDGDKAFAFDVCKYQSYEPPVVNVNTTGKITGAIEVSEEISTNLNISGGTFTVAINEDWCAEGYVPKDNGDGTYGVKEAQPVVPVEYVAEVNGTKYETLAEAVNAANSGDTVTLLGNASGAGVVIDKDITIDLNTFTYTVNQCIGSAGTETLGFQIRKDNNVTIKNGTLAATTVTEGKAVKMLVQNYANLTLTDVTLDGTGSEQMQYVLSNNSGTVNITGETNIIAPEDAVAFDVYDYSSAGYTVPTVNVNTTGKITGAIEVSDTISANLNISGGTFTVAIDADWCAEGYVPKDNGDGTYGVEKDPAKPMKGDLDLDGDVDAYDLTLLARHIGGIESLTNDVALLNADVNDDSDVDATDLTIHARYVGGIITSWEDGMGEAAEDAAAEVNGEKYETLAEAVNAAEDGDTVTLLGDASDAGVVIDKDITIDFGGHTYTFTEGVGSTGTESNGFQILQGNTVTLKNGTLNVAEANKDQFYILVQNYANLTVEDMTLDGTNLDKWSLTDGDSYTLSNNSGTVNITGNTTIIANNDGDKAFAFDVCKYQSYAEPVVTVENTVVMEGEVEAAAKIGNTYYATLAKAVAEAQNGATITLVKDSKGAGVVIDKSIIIDFGGHTYTFTEGVGSTGTESNGFQILQGNTVTLKNGALNVAGESKDKFYMLIQNYANLTVEDMTLDGTNLDKWSLTDGDSYTLSNNSGTVNITGNTTIIANNDGDKAFAFDVCKYQSYEAPVVNVNTTGKITGAIEVSEEISTNLNISGGTFTVEIDADWCAEGYVPRDNGDGSYVVEKSAESETP